MKALKLSVYCSLLTVCAAISAPSHARSVILPGSECQVLNGTESNKTWQITIEGFFKNYTASGTTPTVTINCTANNSGTDSVYSQSTYGSVDVRDQNPTANIACTRVIYQAGYTYQTMAFSGALNTNNDFSSLAFPTHYATSSPGATNYRCTLPPNTSILQTVTIYN